jgi:hypothetical protein
MTRLHAIAALATLTLSGCHLWFNNCEQHGAPDIDAIGLLNPFTGQCEWQGGGGGGVCGDYGGGDMAAPEPVDWAMCYGACTDLGEEACLAADGCRAAYVSDCPELADCDDTSYAFVACWAVAPSGPVQGGECYGLDAYDCSRRDDCVARHHPYDRCANGSMDCAPGMIEPGRAGYFEYCAPEPAADRGTCYGEVFCDSLPPECPADAVPGVIEGCWSGACIPVAECEPMASCAQAPSEAACIGNAACAPIYVGVDCTCDEQTGECTCQDWEFEYCSEA